MGSTDSSREDELHRRLGLPRAERVALGHEILITTTDLLIELFAVIAEKAERILVRYGLANHGEDVANRVMLSAIDNIKKQIAGEICFSWRPQIPLLSWLLLIMGRPFQGDESGVITNYIREMSPQFRASIVLVSLTELNDNGFDIEDDINFDKSSSEFFENCYKLVDQILSEYVLGNDPRNVFVYRLRTGIHNYSKINVEALNGMSKILKMKASERKFIRLAAKNIDITPGPVLSAELIGNLIGVGATRVRQITNKVAKFIEQRVERV